MRSTTLLKERFWHRCFHVNFAKSLRTSIFNTNGNLYFCENSNYLRFLGVCWNINGWIFSCNIDSWIRLESLSIMLLFIKAVRGRTFLHLILLHCWKRHFKHFPLPSHFNFEQTFAFLLFNFFGVPDSRWIRRWAWTFENPFTEISRCVKLTVGKFLSIMCLHQKETAFQFTLVFVRILFIRIARFKKSWKLRIFLQSCWGSRNSRPEVFCKKGDLGNFSKFTGKHLCQSLFF